jgi:hypothetical protein
MSRAREQRRAARRALHKDRAVPALYIAAPGATPVEVTVRVWTQFGMIGRGIGTRPAENAEREEAKPKLIFSTDEITFIRNGAIVSVEAGEAYNVELAHPVDDTTITADVSRVPASQTVGLPVPA